MTNEQREAIDKLRERFEPDKFGGICALGYKNKYCFGKSDLQAIDTVLSLIKEQEEKIETINEYAYQEIVHYTETIKDYKDDDKEGNKHYIEELKEEREHWKDIEKILQNKQKEELYMNWWKYGLYE